MAHGVVRVKNITGPCDFLHNCVIANSIISGITFWDYGLNKQPSTLIPQWAAGSEPGFFSFLSSWWGSAISYCHTQHMVQLENEAQTLQTYRASTLHIPYKMMCYTCNQHHVKNTLYFHFNILECIQTIRNRHWINILCFTETSVKVLPADRDTCEWKQFKTILNITLFTFPVLAELALNYLQTLEIVLMQTRNQAENIHKNDISSLFYCISAT